MAGLYVYNMKIVFATKNKGKMSEIRQIMSDIPCEIISMEEAGIDIDVDETGTTYAENAMLKAEAVYEALCRRQAGSDASICSSFGSGDEASKCGCSDIGSDFIVMSDDSGFEVDYLNKEPGIYSARYMGTETPYSIKNQSIIDKLAGVPDEQRTARFMCAIACILPGGQKEVCMGVYEGLVAHEARGTNGFGYDPIFFVPEMGCTDAELPVTYKNIHGHRGKALTAAKELVLRFLG